MVQCGYAKTLYIYIYLYNVPKPAKLSDLVGKDLSQIALFHFSIAHFKSSSISIKNEHSNITLFSMTYRHTQHNITEHYRTLHRLPPFNTIYSSISRPDTFYSHLTLVTKYGIVYVWAQYIYPTATLWAPHNTTIEEHVMTHTSKTTGKYLHSDIVTHDDVNGDEQDYFHYTWQAKPSDNRSPFPHNNKTERV